jgi:hypothetical protein
MQILILIPAFLSFLYTLYKLVKDDYIFIRKNVSAESAFDIAFILGVVSVFTSRILYFLFHPIPQKNNLILFFTAGQGGFSLLGAVVGAMVVLYGMSKYKKWPTGRLFDFFTLAFSVALPVGILCTAAFYRDYALWLHLGNALFYFISMTWFLRFLYPRLMSRVLREGTISIVFIILFSVVSLVNAIFLQQQGKIILLSQESIGFTLLFLFGVGLLIKQASGGLLNKKR